MSENLLAKALLVAQRAINAVAPDARNKHSGYNYASAEAIITEARAALNGAGLTARRGSYTLAASELPSAQEGVSQQYVLVTMDFHLQHESGEISSDCIVWVAVPHKGMAVDKAIAAALTSSFAYYLRDILLIPRVEHEMDNRPHDDGGGGQPKQPAKKSEVAYDKWLKSIENADGTTRLLDAQIALNVVEYLTAEQTDNLAKEIAVKFCDMARDEETLDKLFPLVKALQTSGGVTETTSEQILGQIGMALRRIDKEQGA